MKKYHTSRKELERQRNVRKTKESIYLQLHQLKRLDGGPYPTLKYLDELRMEFLSELIFHCIEIKARTNEPHTEVIPK